MSDDLISRAEVIKLIDEYGYINCHNSQDFESNSRVDRIRREIVEMPGVCDLEGKILEIKEKLMNCFDEDYAVRLRVKMSAYEEVKEIIQSTKKRKEEYR